LSNQNPTGFINIYPNPAFGRVNINTGSNPENFMLLISNIEGQIMKQVEFKSAGTEKVDVSDLPPGLYLFKIQGNNHVQTFKVMLHRAP